MGLGRFISGIARAAIDVVVLPVEVVRDMADCGKPGQTHTGKRLEDLADTITELPDRIEE